MLNWYDRQPEPPDPATCTALAALVTRLEGRTRRALFGYPSWPLF